MRGHPRGCTRSVRQGYARDENNGAVKRRKSGVPTRLASAEDSIDEPQLRPSFLTNVAANARTLALARVGLAKGRSDATTPGTDDLAQTGQMVN